MLQNSNTRKTDYNVKYISFDENETTLIEPFGGNSIAKSKRKKARKKINGEMESFCEKNSPNGNILFMQVIYLAVEIFRDI